MSANIFFIKELVDKIYYLDGEDKWLYCECTTIYPNFDIYYVEKILSSLRKNVKIFCPATLENEKFSIFTGPYNIDCCPEILKQYLIFM